MTNRRRAGGTSACRSGAGGTSACRSGASGHRAMRLSELANHRGDGTADSGRYGETFAQGSTRTWFCAMGSVSLVR